MKLKSVIVDDEELARENLRMLLEENCPSIEIVGMADGVVSAKEMIDQTSPDVVFLDISMPSGAEGFDLLDSIEEKSFQVIFVTAHKEYAIKAFDANAVHYILKPIDIAALQYAVDKCGETRQLLNKYPDNISSYVKSLETLTATIRNRLPIERITINHSKGFKIVDDDDIVHLKADGNCTLIFFEDKSKYLDTRTLRIYEDILNPNKFCRIHKSHIINVSYLKEYSSEDGYFAVMKDNSKLPISRSRIEEFKTQVIR